MSYYGKTWLDNKYKSNEIETPIIEGGVEITENQSGLQNTITNYNSNYNYSVTSSNNALLQPSLSGDTITYAAGDITDDQDHIIQVTITVTNNDGDSTHIIREMKVKYLNVVTDDAINYENATYTENYTDKIEGGSIQS